MADAIASGDMGDIKDELGDLLFQVVFYAQIANEQDAFSFDDVAQSISDKLVRRHPHVFAGTNSGDTLSDASLNAQWEAIKAQEKRAKKATSNSILDNVPTGMPALMHAQKLQKACAKVGFDWPEVMPVLDKVREEVDEIAQEIHIASESESTESGDILPLNHDAIEEEIGDALFAMVNLSRHLKVDADTALRKASHKFAARFKGVEQLAREQGTELDTMSLEEMETLWQTIKRNS